MGASAVGTRFDRRLQGDFIEARGVKVVHEIGMKCPCRASEDVFASMVNDAKGAANRPWHGLCEGRGFLYRDAQELTGIAQGISQRIDPIELGWAQPGDMLFSPQLPERSGRRIGQWDRLTATWTQPLDGGQVIVRGAAGMGDNVGRSDLAASEDRLWYAPGTDADDVIWCEDEDGVVYEPGAFVLGEDNRAAIRWIGRAPTLGKAYTLKCRVYFQWIVVAPPMERYDQGAEDIGARVLCRKWHVQQLNSATALNQGASLARLV